MPIEQAKETEFALIKKLRPKYNIHGRSHDHDKPQRVVNPSIAFTPWDEVREMFKEAEREGFNRSRIINMATRAWLTNLKQHGYSVTKQRDAELARSVAISCNGAPQKVEPKAA